MDGRDQLQLVLLEDPHHRLRISHADALLGLRRGSVESVVSEDQSLVRTLLQGSKGGSKDADGDAATADSMFVIEPSLTQDRSMPWSQRLIRLCSASTPANPLMPTSHKPAAQMDAATSPPPVQPRQTEEAMDAALPFSFPFELGQDGDGPATLTLSSTQNSARLGSPMPPSLQQIQVQQLLQQHPNLLQQLLVLNSGSNSSSTDLNRPFGLPLPTTTSDNKSSVQAPASALSVQASDVSFGQHSNTGSVTHCASAVQAQPSPSEGGSSSLTMPDFFASGGFNVEGSVGNGSVHGSSPGSWRPAPAPSRFNAEDEVAAAVAALSMGASPGGSGSLASSYGGDLKLSSPNGPARTSSNMSTGTANNGNRLPLLGAGVFLPGGSPGSASLAAAAAALGGGMGTSPASGMLGDGGGSGNIFDRSSGLWSPDRSTSFEVQGMGSNNLGSGSRGGSLTATTSVQFATNSVTPTRSSSAAQQTLQTQLSGSPSPQQLAGQQQSPPPPSSAIRPPGMRNVSYSASGTATLGVGYGGLGGLGSNSIHGNSTSGHSGPLLSTFSRASLGTGMPNGLVSTTSETGSHAALMMTMSSEAASWQSCSPSNKLWTTKSDASMSQCDMGGGSNELLQPSLAVRGTLNNDDDGFTSWLQRHQQQQQAAVGGGGGNMRASDSPTMSGVLATNGASVALQQQQQLLQDGSNGQTLPSANWGGNNALRNRGGNEYVNASGDANSSMQMRALEAMLASVNGGGNSGGLGGSMSGSSMLQPPPSMSGAFNSNSLSAPQQQLPQMQAWQSQSQGQQQMSSQQPAPRPSAPGYSNLDFNNSKANNGGGGGNNVGNSSGGGGNPGYILGPGSRTSSSDGANYDTFTMDLAPAGVPGGVGTLNHGGNSGDYAMLARPLQNRFSGMVNRSPSTPQSASYVPGSGNNALQPSPPSAGLSQQQQQAVTRALLLQQAQQNHAAHQAQHAAAQQQLASMSPSAHLAALLLNNTNANGGNANTLGSHLMSLPAHWTPGGSNGSPGMALATPHHSSLTNASGSGNFMGLTGHGSGNYGGLSPANERRPGRLTPRVQEEILQLLQHVPAFKLEDFDEGVLHQLSLKRSDEEAIGALRSLLLDDVSHIQHMSAYINQTIKNFSLGSMDGSMGFGSLAALNMGNRMGPMPHGMRSSGSGTPVSSKAILQKLPLRVYKRLEEVIAKCSYMDWRHFDAGVIKVMGQLAEVSEDDVYEELELLKSTDLSNVEYMPAYLNKRLNNRLWSRRKAHAAAC